MPAEHVRHPEQQESCRCQLTGTVTVAGRVQPIRGGQGWYDHEFGGYAAPDIAAATDAEAVGWFSMDELPTLAFDHQTIVDMAHQRLVAKLDYSTIRSKFNQHIISKVAGAFTDGPGA